MRKTFGGWLRAEREARGLTLTELAKAVGMAKSAVSRLENDKPAGKMRPVALVKAFVAALDADGLESFAAAGLWPEDLPVETVQLAQRFEALSEEHRRLLTVLLEAMETG